MKKIFFIIFTCYFFTITADRNQTTTIDYPELETPENLPFTIRMIESDFSFPIVPNPYGGTYSGIQGFAYGQYKNKGVFISGRTTGLHVLANVDSFLSTQQNVYIYVLDFDTKTIAYRSLLGASAGLSEIEVDLLTAVAPQYFQLEDVLYIIGGYGYTNTTANFDTKSGASLIDLKKIIDWVENGTTTLSSCISYIENPYLQVTGGDCFMDNRHRPVLLCLGHNYEGAYTRTLNGIYTNQIRGFFPLNRNSPQIIKAKEYPADPNYRRRDLNTVPIIIKSQNTYAPAYVALSGVFTPDGGAWTIPLIINEDGSSYMQDISDPNTFKQGMNGYATANFSMFSIKENRSFVLLFGGISYLYYENGEFYTDDLKSFMNNVTTITIDKNFHMKQYLMENEYPVIPYPILSTTSYFGASAKFISMYSKKFSNGTLAFDKIPKGEEVLIGYIVGGIQSSARHTTGVPGTSIPSAYIFEVYLTKR